MPVCREQAVVLRHQELSGADKIVTFLTLGSGKVKAVAKGARRPKSRFAGSLEPLSLVEVVYFFQPERLVLARLNQSEVLEAFNRLRADYDRLVRALYLAELADAILKEGVPVSSCFEDLVGALRLMEGEGDSDLARWACSWRLLAALGYAPSLGACVACRGYTGLVTFNPGLGGCLCSACRTPERDGLALSPGVRETLQLFGDSPWQRLGRLALKGTLRAEVGRMVDAYLSQHLDRRLKSASLLSDVSS